MGLLQGEVVQETRDGGEGKPKGNEWNEAVPGTGP